MDESTDAEKNVSMESTGKPDESISETADPSETDPGESAQSQADLPYNTVSLKEAGIVFGLVIIAIAFTQR